MARLASRPDRGLLLSVILQLAVVCSIGAMAAPAASETRAAPTALKPIRIDPTVPPGRLVVSPGVLANSNRVLIGDPVIVQAWQLEQVSPTVRTVAFHPFTVAEIQKIQNSAGRTLVTDPSFRRFPNDPAHRRPPSEVTVIRTPKGVLPISTYVAQLNVWEQWLNARGVSLRDPGRTGADGVTRLPLHFRLKAFDTPNPMRVSTGGQATTDPRLIIDPGYPAPLSIDPAARFRVKPNEALAAWAARQSAPALSAGTMSPPPAGAPSPPPPTPPGSKPGQCAGPCPLHYGAGAGGLILSEVGQHIVHDDSWDEACTQGLDNSGHVIQGGCLSESEASQFPDKFKTTKVTHHSYREQAVLTFGQAAVDALIQHYRDPCFMQQLGAQYIDAFYVGKPGTSPGAKSSLKGPKAAQFWDGVLRLSWERADDCLGNTSGNGWFSGYFCLTYGSHAFYDKNEGFDVHDGAGLDAQVTLFGETFPIVNGAQTIDWRQKPADPAKAKPDVSDTLGSYGDGLHYKTPPFIIPIGPVPLSVTGGLDLTYKLGSLDPHFTDLAAFANKTTGQMEMDTPMGASVSLDLFMDASIDVVIASAGIEGKVNAFTGTLAGTMSSSIDVIKNDALLKKTYGFTGSAFSGSISAYVEVWYVVGSKRWTVDIVDFPGVTGSDTPISDQLEGAAVIPASAQTDCQP